MTDWLWGSLFGFLCAFCIYFAISRWRLGTRSRSWPATEGKITSSRLAYTDPINLTGVENPSYSLEVTYEYSVSGVRYSGDTVSFSGAEGPRKEAAQVGPWLALIWRIA